MRFNFSSKNKVALNLFAYKLYIYIYMEVNNGKESDNMEKKMKNKVIQSEEFNVKESRHYNVSVLINHLQNLEKMISSVVRSPMGV